MTKITKEQELLNEIEKLQKQLEIANNRVKIAKYGLVWMEVPEAFEQETENQMPVLEEVKEKAIKNDDGKPTHILIEGDNYHALTCLNYTHKEKIDLIYIDPPYNTGKDGFTYKDKRIIDKFPDGTIVPKDHPLRHSYWLSFMFKRLELAKGLLRDTGKIVVSIEIFCLINSELFPIKYPVEINTKDQSPAPKEVKRQNFGRFIFEKPAGIEISCLIPGINLPIKVVIEPCFSKNKSASPAKRGSPLSFTPL